MADSILRLKVDSNEYESKLKRASQALLSMADEAKRTGASLALADQQELAFVNSLGKLDTSARGAKGTLSELSNTIQDLTMHYNKLSEEDRNSQYGKNLKNSIDELKARHKELKDQMDETSKSMSNHGGILDIISQKVGFNISDYEGLGFALAAVGVAIKVATDAFKQNEELMDAWGQIIESSGSIYNGFLNAINTGDISGYLGRIDQIIKAAKDAYDAIDELATHNAFNQLNVAKHLADQTKAINDYKEGKGSKEDVIKASKTYQEDLENRQKDEERVYRNRVTQVALERGINPSQLFEILQMNQKDFDAIRNRGLSGVKSGYIANGYGSYAYSTKTAANNFEELGEALRQIPDDTIQELQALGAQSFKTSQEIEQNKKMVRRQISGQNQKVNNLGSHTSTTTTLESQFYENPQTLEELSKNISFFTKKVKADGSEEDQQLINNIKLWKEKKAAIEETLSLDKKVVVPPIDLSFSSEGIKNHVKELQAKYKEVGGSDALRNNLIDSATIANLLGSALNNGIDISEFNGEELWKKILNGEDIPDDIWKGILDRINEKLAEAGIGQLDLSLKNGIVSSAKPAKTSTKKEKSAADEALEDISKGLSGLSQISGGLESMGIELSSGFKDTLNIVQGLMSVIQGVQSIISIFSTTSLAANTAAVIANTAALATNSFTNILPFAEGGFLPAAANGIIAGSQYHGDTRAIRVNDGEMIINQTDQAKLYNAIHGDSLSFGNGSSVDIIRGENIYLSMRNYMKRTGRRLPA